MDAEGMSKYYAAVQLRIEEGMRKAQVLCKHTLKVKDLYDEDIRKAIY
ncbi:rCG36449 [Rattus norvegicus]|uniref:RCG36449 n=1 Tax=Rattus norvegicus TaxID=10116 RepID=A6IQ55_RAT|nr:rCG36449 [Rattus norvegicus]